ncbi:NADP-dependent oxidoreductase [Streptomyces sp. NPDC006643]|uniref:NADP-dependent oxidoreductase n=2 Tax=unclassified Streptomyces TaxID=2593676 RepID=UPI0036C27899
MRAVRYERYGPPEVLTVQEVPVPAPGPGQFLLKVHATSVNPAEAMVRSGRMKVMSGFRFPKGTGEDFAGTIVAGGPDADENLIGEQVWGLVYGLNAATAAEYITVKESQFALAPTTIDLVTAAALPTVGSTALTALRAVRLAAGERLLVVGASGGIGSSIVQIAAAKGAVVATVSSGGNADFLTGLGAKETYDYAKLEDLASAPEFDAVVDLHGTELDTYRRRVRSGGRIVTFAMKGMAGAMASIVKPGARVGVAQLKPRRADLEELTRLVESGELHPQVERIYPMDAIAEAHRSVESGHSRGKRVVRIARA